MIRRVVVTLFRRERGRNCRIICNLLLPEAEVVLLVHELVPLQALVVAGEAQDDVGEAEFGVPPDGIVTSHGNGHTRSILHRRPKKQAQRSTPADPAT